jgi:hypothetical protein
VAIPTVTLIADFNIIQEGTLGQYTILLDEPAPIGGLIINYSVSGSAIEWDDYWLYPETGFANFGPTSFTIIAGQTSATIGVETFADSSLDPNETIRLTLTAGSNYTLGSNSNSPFVAAPLLTATGMYSTNRVELADFDGDGKADLAVVSDDGVSIYFSAGLGDFNNAGLILNTPNLGPLGQGDFNGDGFIDLAAVASNGFEDEILLLAGSSAGNFNQFPPTSGGSSYIRSITVGDFHGDGKDDIAAITTDIDTGFASVLVFSGSTSGLIQQESLSGSSWLDEIASGDFDNDGRDDLVVANNNSLEIYIYNGGAGFSSSSMTLAGASSFTSSIAAGDLNHDGFADLALARNQEVEVYLWNSLGNYFSSEGTVSYGIENNGAPLEIEIEDMSGDGQADLIVTAYNLDAVSVHLGDGTGHFNGGYQVAVGDDPTDLALGDIDGDGRTDFVTANYQSNDVSVRLAAPPIAELIINESLPTVELSTSSVTGNENDATEITVTATASHAVSGDQTVDLTVLGTDITPDDFTLSGATIVISDGQTTGSVTFTVLNDGQVESEETAVLTLATPSNGLTLGTTISQNITLIDYVNSPPTLTGFAAAIDTTDEDTEVEITFDELTIQGNEVDGDGSVAAFVVQEVTSGTLRIGANAWDAITNNTINASTPAYWTPTANANGTLDAFTVVTEDNLGAVSATPVTAQVNVNIVNDAPVLAGTPTLTAISEDITSEANSGTSVADLLNGLSTDADFNLQGIAVTGVDNTNGNWQYSTDGGTTWQAFPGSVSASSAITLGATSLYTYTLGTAPAAQGQLDFATFNDGDPFGFLNLPIATEVVSSDGTLVDTTAAPDIYAGYSNRLPSLSDPPFVDPSFPGLDNVAGYSISFNLEMLAETRTNENRAAFSLLAVSADTTQAIEIGFQRLTETTGNIFAQEGGTSPNLFTAAENVSFNTNEATQYTLNVLGSSYELFANDGTVPILSGNLRNYTAFEPSLPVPDPYELPSYIYLGDNTTSAKGTFVLSDVAVSTETLVRFVPDIDYNGDATISFRAWDTTDGSSNGEVGVDTSVNGGETAFSSESVTGTIAVAAVNDQPSFMATDPATTERGLTTITIPNWAAFEPGGGTDEVSQTVVNYTVSGVSNPDLFTTVPGISPTGELTYTLDPKVVGTSDFTVTVQDNGGTENAGVDTSNAQTFTITVEDTVAPSFTSITRQTPADTPTNADSLTFLATFSEGVVNVDATDFVVTGATGTPVDVAPTGDAAVYAVTVSGGNLAELNGTVGLDLNTTNQNIADVGGNALPNAEPATDETYTLENTQSGDIIITEIMQNPNAVGDTAGEWFELYNPTANDIDINGWVISDTGSNLHIINNAGPLIIAAGGYLVLGRNADTTINGGVTLNYAYGSAITLGNTDDEIILTNTVGVTIDQVAYDGGPNFPNPIGASMTLIDPALDNALGTNWDTANTAYGAGDFGTPGAENIILPEVSLIASDTTAIEAPADTATFTVSRNHSEGALTIILDLAGEAIATDYSFSAGEANQGQLTVTLLDGQASLDITVTAVDDGLVEANATLTITLASDGAYVINSTANTSSISLISDDTSPVVTSITRAGIELTNAASVDYTVTFDRPVIGVDSTDFTLTTTGITGASVANVTTADDMTYTVTVNTGTGNGTLRLDLVDDNSITDSDTNPLGGVAVSDGDFNLGESYILDKAAPDAPIITSLSNDTATADNITTDSTLIFTGTAETDNTVEVFLADGIGTVSLGSVTATGVNWTFDYTNTPLADGTYTLTAKATDAVGNTSITSPGFDFTVDTTPPVVTNLVSSVSTLQDANVGSGSFSLTVSFSEAMDSSMAPTLSFPTSGEDPSSTLTFNSGTWTDSTTYVATYDVVDTNATVSDIDVQVTEAQDLAGNLLSSSVQADQFSLNMASSVGFANLNDTVAEGVGNSTVVTLTRSGDLSGTATAQVDISGGTATGNGTDYDSSNFPLTVTFTPNVSTQTVTIPITDDVLYEPGGDETILLSLSNLTNASVGQATTTLNLGDNDIAPTVGLGLTGSPLTETGGIATVTATLSNPSTEDVIVDLTFSGTATGNGTDYTASNTSILILAGTTEGSITLAGKSDSLDEDDETIVVKIDGITNALESGAIQVTATLIDDDLEPALSVNNVAIDEGANGTRTPDFTISLSAPSSKIITVDYATADDTATTDDSDYLASSGTLIFNPGETAKTVNITVNGDTTYENNESFFVNLSNSTNATLAGDQGTGTLTNDDTPPTVSFTTANQSVSEAAGNATITAQLSAPSALDVTIPFIIDSSSTATSGGTDYSLSPTLLTISAGNTTADLTLTLVDDAIDETDETIVVNLDAPTNAILGPVSSHTFTLIDDDTAGIILTETDGTTIVNESGSTDTITVVLTSQPTSNVVLAITSSDPGEATASATPSLPLVFTPNTWATPQTVTITGVDDLLDDGDQTVNITLSVVDASSDLSYISLADQIFTVTVGDNDSPPNLITNAGLTLDEGATRAIVQSILETTDAEQATAEVTYTLSSAVQTGILFLDKDANATFDATTDTDLSQSGSTFTQADINSGKLVYTHNGSETTSDGFSFTVSDGSGGTIGETAFSITITPVNDVPGFLANNPTATDEDSGLVSVANWASFDPGPGETDQTATYTVSNITNPALFAMAPAVAADGTLTFTPAENQFGTSEFTVQVQDSGGTANGGVNMSPEQTFTITVNAANDAPTFIENSIDLTFDTIPGIGKEIYTVSATDIDADSLNYSIESGNDGNTFAIDSTTGLISVADDSLFGTLTPNSPLKFGLTVQVQDRTDTTALTDTMAVNVTLTGMQGHADFNQDGMSDLLWRDTNSGLNFAWYLNNGTPIASFQLLNVPSNYTLAGTGDLDADGHEDDLVWRDAGNTKTTFWYTEYGNDTLQLLAGSDLWLDPGGSWEIQGVGDFDGDGYQDDLVWVEPFTRNLSIWYTDNGQLVGGGMVAGTQNLEEGWAVDAVGNFDDDGLQDDLVWRNGKSGATFIWLMDGTTPIESAELLTIDPSWHLAGAADYDGDQKPDDLVWQNSSLGTVDLWFLEGTQLIEGVANAMGAPAGFEAVV